MSVQSQEQNLMVGKQQIIQQKKPIYGVLLILSTVHLMNDAISALVTAMFPILELEMSLSYTEIGLIALALNLTGSVIQPVVGLYTDKKPLPLALPFGMCFTFIGVILLALAPSLLSILIAVTLIGVGSATFHPEGARVTHMAAGTQRGLAQSIFQVGGNIGQALAPIITALLLVPLGKFGSIYFAIVVGIAILLLFYIANWYRSHVNKIEIKKEATEKRTVAPVVFKNKVKFGFCLLLLLVFIRSWFNAGIGSYYQFFAIDHYSLTISQAQVYIFIFLASGAIGTFFGGPLADKFGKKNILIFSMVGATPFSLLLPHVGAGLAYLLIGIVGFITLSGFSVAVVYAQELIPGKIGVVSGLVVGLAFGMGAIGAVIFGVLADKIGIHSTILIATSLPVMGVLSFLLPTDKWVEENAR